MGFSDPQSVTISGSAVSLPRTSVGVNSSQYTSADSVARLTISSTYGRRTRRVVKLDHSKIAADPITANNVRYSAQVYVVFDVPKDGYSITELTAVTAALTAWLTATNVGKVLGGEN